MVAGAVGLTISDWTNLARLRDLARLRAGTVFAVTAARRTMHEIEVNQNGLV